jgi:hypothetical protein
MTKLYTLLGALLFCAATLPAQQTVFKDVKIRRHRNAEKRVLVDKLGKLTFDDTARKLTFEGEAGDHNEVSYDSIDKANFEVTTHMRGGGLSQVVEATGLAGLFVGNKVASGHVNSYWFYLEYLEKEGERPVLFEVPKESSSQVIDKAKSVFGSRVKVNDYPEKGVPIKPGDLKSMSSKQSVKVDKQNHPLPELQPGKATLVVVCPPLAARYVGKGTQVKLHANDQVIAVK